ncbi:hypothetical protein Peur_002075 [Populus x canadensis]
MPQFHGGGFVKGSNESVGNDAFCGRITKQCDDIIVVVVGYRLAPETRNPGAFEDGFKVLNWLAKQSNLAACGIVDAQSHIFYSFDASMVKPWLAAHGDPSRFLLDDLFTLKQKQRRQGREAEEGSENCLLIKN